METGTANEGGNKRGPGRPPNQLSEEEMEKKEEKEKEKKRERSKEDRDKQKGLQKLFMEFRKQLEIGEKFKDFCEKREEKRRKFCEQYDMVCKAIEEDLANQYPDKGLWITSDKVLQEILEAFTAQPKNIDKYKAFNEDYRKRNGESSKDTYVAKCPSSHGLDQIQLPQKSEMQGQLQCQMDSLGMGGTNAAAGSSGGPTTQYNREFEFEILRAFAMLPENIDRYKAFNEDYRKRNGESSKLISWYKAVEESGLFDSLPDHVVISILSKLSSSAGCPADFINVLMTCKRLNRLALDRLVLSKASSKMFPIKVDKWFESARRFLTLCVNAGNADALSFRVFLEFFA